VGYFGLILFFQYLFEFSKFTESVRVSGHLPGAYQPSLPSSLSKPFSFLKFFRGVRTLSYVYRMYIHGLHSIQPTCICRLLVHNTHFCVLEGFLFFLKDFFFLGKKLCASRAFLNSSGSLLIVFGWVKDSIYLSLCKEPLLFLYFLLFSLKV
jgi:hypothetical protein